MTVGNRAPRDHPGPGPTWLCSQPVQGAAGLARSSCSSASQRRISCLSRSFSTISRSRCFSKSVPPCREPEPGGGGMWRGQIRGKDGAGRQRQCRGRGEGRGGETERRRKEKERPVMDGEKRGGAPETIKTKAEEKKRWRRVVRQELLPAAPHPFHSIFLSVKVTRKVIFIHRVHTPTLHQQIRINLPPVTGHTTSWAQ